MITLMALSELPGFLYLAFLMWAIWVSRLQRRTIKRLETKIKELESALERKKAKDAWDSSTS